MRHSPHELLVLKPSPVFLAYLAAKLPGTELPSLKLLNIDNTAYVFEKQKTNQDMLDQIGKKFSLMFHHEISRWLGDKVHDQIETSYLDFVCCFKFELHNHIVLMEKSIEQGKSLLIIQPRQALLDWIKEELREQEELVNVLDKVELTHIIENATSLVKNFQNLSEIKPFINIYYPSLFKMAMSRISSQSHKWPQIHSIQTFSLYFAIEVHTQLIHL